MNPTARPAPGPSVHTPSSGLTTREAEELRRLHGAHEIVPEVPRSAWRRILRSATDPTVLLLAAVAAVELVVGEKREALVLLAAILPIAGMGVFLEWKSESAREALRKLTVRRARVRRDGELLLRLRWLAILSGRVKVSLAVTGGVHTAHDAIKAVMAGAHAVQMVSALLRRGPEHLRRVREEMEQWTEEHGYESLRQMQGSMSLAHSPNPGALERSNYMRVLQSWRS